ncbi:MULTISPECIES: hypothetical protein [Clostridium]|uniref:hypothetical protein n=1 Tax=Clostridium TaxID=1485 RepID=UPI001C0CCB47|nr:hypothetical protein [Clostridium bowmanii]MBU3190701.1 hypothetical protein [Clostridium bowmanii]MCA1075053.1 hypothetical protein [Clostridium bowmanii]
MIITKKYIQNLSNKSFLNISENMKNIILENLGKEPEPDEAGHYYEYTDQDIGEQVRKILVINKA